MRPKYCVCMTLNVDKSRAAERDLETLGKHISGGPLNTMGGRGGNPQPDRGPRGPPPEHFYKILSNLMQNPSFLHYPTALLVGNLLYVTIINLAVINYCCNKTID